MIYVWPVNGSPMQLSDFDREKLPVVSLNIVPFGRHHHTSTLNLVLAIILIVTLRHHCKRQEAVTMPHVSDSWQVIQLASDSCCQ